MIIAAEKRKTNIAEYVLYMWQIEDIIRACKLNIDIIAKEVLPRYEVDIQKRKEILEWYESLIHMMHSEKIAEKGHLFLTLNAISQMEELHNILMQQPKEIQYKTLYFAARPNIINYRAKSNNPELSDIRICLDALYMLLLMRLSKKEISLATQQAMDTFSKLLAALSQRFVSWEKGELKLE